MQKFQNAGEIKACREYVGRPKIYEVHLHTENSSKINMRRMTPK